MISHQDIDSIIGSTAVDAQGDKIGSVGQVYLDDRTGEPAWATVRTGFFGTNESFVPLEGATYADGSLRVQYDKAEVKDAPNVADDGHLEPGEEQRLYRHYGLGEQADPQGLAAPSGVAAADGDADDRDAVGHDTSGPTTDDAMTRSEERLTVGTRTEEAGRARLRKYVVTEQETVTVPVTREEVRVEREPITDANVGDAVDGPAISEEEHEVVLHEERPVVGTEAVPVERVRMTTDTVTDSEQVSGEVRKEVIDVDGEGAGETTSGVDVRGERTRDPRS